MRIAFYANTYIDAINRVYFYKQDIDILEELGHEVIVCTKYVEIIKTDFDLLFIWWWSRALLPVLYAKFRGKKSLITGTFNYEHGNNENVNDYIHKPFWQKKLLKWAYNFTNLNVLVSNNEYMQLSRAFKGSNQVVIGHCFDPDLLLMKNDEIKKIDCIDLNNSTLNIFNIAWKSLGNMERKGLFSIIKALPLLKNQGIEFKLILAGKEGTGSPILQKMINDLDVAEFVTDLGVISENQKKYLLKHSDIYLQPSNYEGFGLAILEAMALGGMIITCDAGATTEVVGNTGVFVRKKSPEDICRAISELTHEDRVKYKKKAQARAKNEFSFEIKKDKVSKILDSLFSK
jgi:glycosyltransferase involved in cell wall biosynthesis